MPDSAEYKNKKAYFDKLLTVYGRKPVLEAFEVEGLDAIKLHLSERNRPAKILDEILDLASRRNTEVAYHSAQALSRISRNAKQDQGVALDVRCPNFQSLEEFLAMAPASNRVIALDRVTNPQNMGMIIRSVAASTTSALIIPRKGCAPLNSLVIKASTGVLFRAPIVQVDDLGAALDQCEEKGFTLASLEADADDSLLECELNAPTVFVLGNETDGVSMEISRRCKRKFSIPMQRNVESLNVAVTAALVAFLPR